MALQTLTAKTMEHLTTTRVQEEIADPLTPGLSIRIGRGGTKTFYARYRFAGRVKRLKLGVYPRLSLADAREKARDALKKADAGEDPAVQRETAKSGARTFRTLAEAVLTGRAERGRDGKPTRDRTQYERRRLLDRELLPHWGDRDARTIKGEEVVELLASIRDRGAPVVANRTLSLVRLIFNDGIRRQRWEGLTNPAHLLEPVAYEEARDRWLTADEIKAVWKATEDENPSIKAIYRLAILTGQREGSICAMRWEDVSDGGVWSIPAEFFKGRRVHLVPLSVEAFAVLEPLREEQADETWVFPSREKSKRRYLTNLGTAQRRIRGRTKIPHWVLHDLRTTLRTNAVKLGIDPTVADRVLGHAEGSLGFARYQGDKPEYRLEEKADALRRYGAFVREAVR